ncbi:MAG: cation:proton antiporter regulatory subunit [Planctomycetota bacterium]|jgi:TrkA domain protein
MVEVKETDLPAIGKKFTIESESGETVIVVVRLNGERELYRFTEDKEIPISETTFTEDEARTVGSILAGSYFQPVQEPTVELLLKDMTMEWVKVEPGSVLEDKTIGELAVRRKTGVSIISILRKGKVIPNPLAKHTMRKGDTIVVVGRNEQVKAFLSMVGDPREKASEAPDEQPPEESKD